jgi:putative membrane protein
MAEMLSYIYPWVKALHIMAVISWMAGLFYLPRLFVHHSEQVKLGSDTDQLFQMMERKLLRVIMNPAMIVTWICGLLLIATPGIVDWGSLWPWTKAAAVIAMTWFHMWCSARRKDFVAGTRILPGRTYRIMNEVPTLMMLVIVISVVVRPF